MGWRCGSSGRELALLCKWEDLSSKIQTPVPQKKKKKERKKRKK
jgi:hypothetical protein